MVSEKELLELFNKFPEVPERFKEHLKSQIKWQNQDWHKQRRQIARHWLFPVLSASSTLKMMKLKCWT